MAILVAALTGCKTYSHSYRMSEVPDKDLNVAEKYVVDIKHDFTKIVRAESGKHKSPSAAKEEAYYKAIVDNNIHVVVDPIYSVETSARILIFGGKSKATIVGFAGYYQNPRTVSKAKAELNKSELEAVKIASDKFEENLKGLEKFSKIAALGQEQTETFLIDAKGSSCCVGSDGKSTGSTNGQFGQMVLLNKSVNKPSLVDQYLKFVNGTTEESKSTVVLNNGLSSSKTAFSDETKKPSGIKAFLAKIPLLGKLFK